MGHTFDAPGSRTSDPELHDAPRPGAEQRSVAEAPGAGHHPRKDIQALRALAVGLVVVYHFWPTLLPGGYVGVDVFFVISGFLITGALVRRPPTGLRGLGDFWARRVLRLAPAVAVTLLVSLLTIIWVLPLVEWRSGAEHALTSMLYVENWRLISDATDYLRADGTPSPFQHFWSLSVEEQFYLGWPLLIGLVAILSVRLRAPFRSSLGVCIAAVTLASFAYSLLISWSQPSLAYFSTPARIWELGLGGVLAIWGSQVRRPSRTAAAVMPWSAVAAMFAAALLLDDGSVFPGWNALLPTLGAALFILAGDPDGRLSLRGVTHAGPVQLVGNISYAIYLWHWPMLLLLPPVLGLDESTWLKLLLLPLVVALSWVSTRFVEDRFRAAPGSRNVGRRGLVVLLVTTGLVVSLCLAMLAWVDREAEESGQRLAQLSSTTLEPTCLGAGALDEELSCPDTDELITTPEFIRTDIPSSIVDGQCLNWPPFGDLVSCEVGETESPTKRIGLYGNSHAGHWQPALEAIAEEHGWQVDTFVMGMCQPIIDSDRSPGVLPDNYAQCDRLGGEILDQLTSGDYDLVVMSTMDHHPTEPDAYVDTIERLTGAGVPVLTVRDTPAPLDPEVDTSLCLSRNPDDWDACGGTPAEWIRQDPLYDAAKAMGDPMVTTADLNEHLCREEQCDPVIGGVIVYADPNHMSATLNRTLAPYLEPHVVRALRSGH
ncbi:acyltransferase family protein [Nocardioides houyundeii]|uniref:acyltransferase family protein n=1 Tax=Nocardioides houyundeii TaxID=2045452 RepID=UPI000C787118|nr:acyltransferase family protein [Nocardioides houyundeii]